MAANDAEAERDAADDVDEQFLDEELSPALVLVGLGVALWLRDLLL